MVNLRVRSYLQSIGRKGGHARAQRLSPAMRQAQARRAAVSRWMRARFATETFETLAIPGWEIVDPGLRDLAQGSTTTVSALAVAELCPRLRFLGVPVPAISDQAGDLRAQLYRMMELEHADMAHERFCALLGRLDSFCETLAATVARPQEATHRNRMWCA